MSPENVPVPPPGPTGPGAGVSPESARHASWLELFFDLVAVAGVAQLAHLLHDAPPAGDLALYCVLYLAFWTAWMCFTTYGNVAAGTVHTRTVLMGMFGLAVMAAAVPEVRGEHARAFALAYVLVRVVASRAWQGRGEVLADWPAAQLTAGVLPWLVSLRVEGTGRYWLWAAGLAVDLGLTFAVSRNRMLAHARKEWEEHREERKRRDGTAPVAARFDPRHLDERLGLFALIVLGEGVAQGVEAASEAEWDRRLAVLAVGSFLLLLVLWSLSVRRSCGVPLLGSGVLAPRFALPLHCVATGSLAALAASLGGVMKHAEGPLPSGTHLLLCGSVAVFLAVGLIAGAAAGRGGPWVAAVGGPMVVVPVLLAVFADGWYPEGLVLALFAVAYWPLAHDKRIRRRTAPSQRGEEGPSGKED